MKMNEEARPKLKPKLTTVDYILEGLAILGIIAIWLVSIFFYNPFFLYPTIVTVLLAGLTALNRYPQIFNYPVVITAENAAWQYGRATRAIRFIKLLIILVFLIIGWQVCKSPDGRTNGMPGWLLPVIIVIPVFLPILLAFVFTQKNPGKQ